MTNKLTVLLVDDHALFREGLAGLFAYQDDFLVVGEAGDGAEAVRMASDLAPHLQELLADYRGIIAGLDTSTGRITELERKLVQAFGNLLIS